MQPYLKVLTILISNIIRNMFSQIFICHKQVCPTLKNGKIYTIMYGVLKWQKKKQEPIYGSTIY